MNQHDLPRSIPEFGAHHGAYRQRRRVIVTIAAVCAVAFAYGVFPTTTHFVIAAAAVIAAIAFVLGLTIAGVVQAIRNRAQHTARQGGSS